MMSGTLMMMLAFVPFFAFAELAGQPDFSALYVELWDDADARKKRKAKSASKTRYTCPSCDMNAWAKPGARLVCGECDEPMAAEEVEGS